MFLKSTVCLRVDWTVLNIKMEIEDLRPDREGMLTMSGIPRNELWSCGHSDGTAYFKYQTQI